MFEWEFKRCKANDNYIRQKTDTSKEQSEPHDRRSMMVRRGYPSESVPDLHGDPDPAGGLERGYTSCSLASDTSIRFRGRS